MGGTFQKVAYSDAVLFGERKLLLCGFSPEAQPKFKTLLSMIGLANIPLVWVTSDQHREILSALMSLPDGSGEGSGSNFPRTIVVAGISEKELHQLMSGCRKAGMKQALWAVLTEFSEQWSISDLIKELQAERKALSEKNKQP